MGVRVSLSPLMDITYTRLIPEITKDRGYTLTPYRCSECGAVVMDRVQRFGNRSKHTKWHKTPMEGA